MKRSAHRPTDGPGWLTALPAIGFLVAFHLAPTIVGARYAATDWNGFGTPVPVGLSNFAEIWADPSLRSAFLNTLLIASAFFVLVNVVGLLLALTLTRRARVSGFVRALIFVPVVLSPLAVGYIWRYLFDFYGPINEALVAVGLDEWTRPWTADPTWAIWTIVVVLVWQYTGLTMVIYMAGIQGIPDEILEAASVDGAGPFIRVRSMILPLLAPAMTIAATLTLILGLRVFDQVIALTGGGPAGATETLATQVWEQTFVIGRFGLGSAFALMLTALIACLALSQLVILVRREKRVMGS